MSSAPAPLEQRAREVVGKVAANVIYYRNLHDLTLDEVARRAGMSKSHVWEIEKGRQRQPTVAAVMALAEAFGVSLSDMLGEDAGASKLTPEALAVAAHFDAAVWRFLASQEQQ